MRIAPKLENLVAVRGEDRVSWLGHLMWYSVFECRIPRNNLERMFVEADLDPRYLPHPINYRDAFRRASTVDFEKRHPLGDGKFLNLLIRDVKQNGKQIVRQLVREIIDENNIRLEYNVVASLILDEDTSLSIERLRILNETERQALDRIIKEYETNKTNYNSQTIRYIIKRILGECQPVNVRQTGGVYFIPLQHEAQILALEKLINVCLAPFTVGSGVSRVCTIPVVDTEKQREMVGESLEVQIETETRQLLEEMTRLIQQSERKVRRTTIRQYVERANSLQEMVGQYKDRLKLNLTRSETLARLVVEQAVQLFGRIGDEEEPESRGFVVRSVIQEIEEREALERVKNAT